MSFDEQYTFSSKAKKNTLILLIVGIVFTALGALLISTSGHGEGEHGDGHGDTHQQEAAHAGGDGHGDGHQPAGGDGHHAEAGHGDGHAADAAHGGEEGHGESHGGGLLDRFFVNIWINNIYFLGLALTGVFFVAIQYAAKAGWSATIKRVPESFGYWLPIAFVITIVMFFVGGHTIFHWTHTDLYDTASSHFDAIINGKSAFFYWPLNPSSGVPLFFLLRMVIFFAVWYLLFLRIRKTSLEEDANGGEGYWRKLVRLSAIFLVFFAVSSSVSAWDWVMSIDTHWFSTMFGWYVFASWWVSGLSAITLLVIYLKNKGLLKAVNANHLHDLGKFMFAFSVFWTYIWFSQFLLIYYANIPEESIYFVQRFGSMFGGEHYAPVFFTNLILNFFFPFLVLMTRDSKRHAIFLQIVCCIILFGHWLDFYLMITPGTLKQSGGFGFLEIGLILVFAALFARVVLSNLAKVPLIAKNHPMLQESVHHDI